MRKFAAVWGQEVWTHVWRLCLEKRRERMFGARAHRTAREGACAPRESKSRGKGGMGGEDGALNSA
jgi:hypothetical protein